MCASPRRLGPLLLGGILLTFVAPSAGSMQERTILSSQIAVSRQEAALELEFSDGRDLVIALRGGQVDVDGENRGSYEPEGALDTAWRTLLGQVVTLDDGPLARALRDWEPPEGLSGESSTVAERIDQALEEALAPREASVAQDPPAAGESEVGALLRRTSALSGLAEALESLDLDRIQLRVGEDVEIAEDQVLEGTLVVVDGDLTIRGMVRGDVVVTGGTLRLAPGGRITGEARLLEAEMENDGGEVAGPVRTISADAAGATVDREDLEKRIRRQLRDEIRREVRGDVRPDRGRGGSGFGHWLSHVGEGIGGMIRTVATFVVLSLIGLAVIRFAPDNLGVVAETVRRSPGRSAAVGTAGLVLLLPAWVLGMVALAISIVGLVALPFWIVLFPVAAILAAGLGYLAVARNVGEWVVDQRFRWLESLRLRSTNTVHTLTAGLAALLSVCLLGHAMELFGGFLGFLEVLLFGAAGMITLVATMVGFGAVLITRGGRQSGWGGGDDLFGGPLWPSDGGGRDPAGPGGTAGWSGTEGPTEPGFGHTGTRGGPTPGSGAAAADPSEHPGPTGGHGPSDDPVPTEDSEPTEDPESTEDSEPTEEGRARDD